MFSLVITIIAIVLVAALALATLYYGGDAFKNGNVQAVAARVLNEGQQLAGAIEMYKSDNNGTAPTDLNQLVSNSSGMEYLKALPKSTTWTPANDYVVASDLTLEQCQQANKMLGITAATIPSCSDTSYTGRSFCCQQ